jgi:hypothetical protein
MASGPQQQRVIEGVPSFWNAKQPAPFERGMHVGRSPNRPAAAEVCHQQSQFPKVGQSS